MGRQPAAPADFGFPAWPRRWATATPVLIAGWLPGAALLSVDNAAEPVEVAGVAALLAAPLAAGYVACSRWWPLPAVGVPFALAWLAVAASEGQGALGTAVLVFAVLVFLVIVAVLPLTLVGVAVGRFRRRRVRASVAVDGSGG
jgi:hypothetical protein